MTTHLHQRWQAPSSANADAAAPNSEHLEHPQKQCKPDKSVDDGLESGVDGKQRVHQIDDHADNDESDNHGDKRHGAPPHFVKQDSGKLPLDLMPFAALEEMGRVLAFGAQKYRPHGWRLVDKRSRYLAAALRHLFAYAQGDDLDAESGLSHLSHALTCVAFLCEAD